MPQRLLLTLLFLGAVGVLSTWDLRGYTADGLALLTGRARAYRYHYTEAFLSQVAHAGGAGRLTDTLACWMAQLWHTRGEAHEQPSTLTCYNDGYRKPFYTDALIPGGLVGRLSTVLGYRALVLLHHAQWHPLLAMTYRGDQHLMIGLPAIVAHYEQLVEKVRLSRTIVDREAMGIEFLARLQASGRTVVTVLWSDQYRDLASFSEVGVFVPLSTDARGQIVREVARASIALPRPDHLSEVFSLRLRSPLTCALWFLFRRSLRLEHYRRVGTRIWGERNGSGGKTASKPPQLRPKRQPQADPIVTTADTCDAVELALAYIDSWPAKENIIKEYLRLLGLEIV